MADCSRPPHSQPRSVFGFRSKGAYDDVFVSRPQMRAPAFTPGVKDYAEIFNCSSSSKPSSIPVLDLDEFHKEVNDEDMVDYGNVFGGFSDAGIGLSYEDVFSVAADGVSRKATDSHAHSRGTARSAAVEHGLKMPHKSLWEKKRSMSFERITHGGKGEAYETDALGKFSEVPVPASTFDGTVPLKKASFSRSDTKTDNLKQHGDESEVPVPASTFDASVPLKKASLSRSDTTTNNVKQHNDELPLGKHSRNVSSSGLPKHGGDEFLETHKRFRNVSGLDKAVSSDTQMETKISRPNVQISEATAATDSSLHLAGSVSTYSDVYRHNAHAEGRGGSKKSSEEGMRVRSMDGLDKPFIRDANEDESVIKHYSVRTHLSPDLTHEHSCAFGTLNQATGNCIALNSDSSENAKCDSYRNSVRDVKFHNINDSSGSFVKYSKEEASDAKPHEHSDFAPAMQAQQSYCKMNAAAEGNVIPEVTDTRNGDGESTHRDSYGHLSNGIKSKNEVEHVGAAKRKTSTSKIDVSKTSTYLSANNSPCSSDEEIDKHSEASVSVAAVRKAIKEAQALINVAKESNGIKGFMSLAMARKSGQVKVAKEEQNSKVNENSKCSEVAAKIQNHSSRSTANTAPWCIGSEMKMASADMVIEGSNLKGAEFSTFNKPDQMKAVNMPSSLREKTQESATAQHALPRINSFQEKLAAYSSIMDQKLAPIKEDVALPCIVAASGPLRIVPEAECSIVPNVEKREPEVNSASQEAFLKNSPESSKKDNVALPGIVAASGQIRIFPEADCSTVPNVENKETKSNKVGQEAFLENSPKSNTGDEKESLEPMNSSNQVFMMQNFHDHFVKTMTECSIDSFDVKEDAVAENEHIHANQNEAIKVDDKDHASSDLTSLEEENVEESELERYDQELDSEDTDSLDYASAEENWVPTDTDDEINENDHNFSAKNYLDEIDGMESMLVPEVTDDASAEENWVRTDTADEINENDHNFSAKRCLDEIDEMENMLILEITESENNFPASLNNLYEDQIVGKADDVPLRNILVSDEKAAPVAHDSIENPVVEKSDKSEDISLPTTVTRDTEVTSEEVTSPVLNEDLIVEETDGSENGVLHGMLIHKVKFTSEETTMQLSNYSDEDPIAEVADISEDVEDITSEDGVSLCFNSANRDTCVEIEGTVDMTGQPIANHEPIFISENDKAPFYDKSHEDLIVDNDGDDTTSESGVCLQNEQETTGAAMLHEQINPGIEMLDCVARIETESAPCLHAESSQHKSSEVELIRTDDLAEEPTADSKQESISTPLSFEPQNQKIDDKNFCDPDPKVPLDREELLNDEGVEEDATEEGQETIIVKGFENDIPTADSASKEGANETDSSSLNFEHFNSELEVEVQIVEPLPDSIKSKETTEAEQLSEDFFQQVERHERRKWDICRETVELPEMEIGAPVVQNNVKQDSDEIERQIDRHERKKWEIPHEKFELPVLGDVIVEKNEEIAGHYTEGASQSALKPERKKWKIQKEEFEVPMPILCAEAVQDSQDLEGFVIRTPFEEEMGMTHNTSSTITFPEEVVQHEEMHDEYSANAKAVPVEAASSELCSENSEEIAKESVSEIKMSSEEEPCTQLGESSDQQYSKEGEGKAVKQEDVNVKEEIKRTLGMLWKKIYNIKQDETSESVELTGKESVNVNDTTGQGIAKDLNLKGPVQLVESPRQQDDTETLNFGGYRKGNKDSLESPLYTEPFEVNESREFVSVEIREVQRNSPLAFNSCKYQEGEIRSGSEENENYNANHPESQSEEDLSGSESENCTEMTPTHETCDLNKEGNQTCKFPSSIVYEHGEMDSETVSESKHRMVEESLVDNAESTHKTKVLQQDGLNDLQDDNSVEILSEVELEMHNVDDLSNKRCADGEQHDTKSSRQNMKSVSDSDVPDVTQAHGFEQGTFEKETCTDKIEQPSSWKWIFGDELKEKSNEQDEAPDVKNLDQVKGKTKERTDANEMVDDNDISYVSKTMKIDGDKPTLMEDRVPSRMHKEAAPDQEAVKNLKRAKERERIAVERAIREARERAFIEARERAAMERENAVARETSAKEKTNLESRERIALERANAQVRERAATERAKADLQQKVNSDGQERSQRTSSEAKLASERNSLEAKRKAELERAAVERATTEARQRALEKAMSRKDQVAESTSRSGSASSDQYGSASKERLNEDKPSESALRFKARNERHQRIAERAAKALAEKNMRDILVQREQAERNRLAEVLDADVKRWARGKTGNLRALLSTLQYILGPDSGWQAIHLTEIVTADAVKKAYRKATLFVHPDKLQQRGATIRQKYICEKVFDLLKEAWNKFDRDER